MHHCSLRFWGTSNNNKWKEKRKKQIKTAEKERITIHNSLIMVTNAAFSECTSWGMKQTKMNAERERKREEGKGKRNTSNRKKLQKCKLQLRIWRWQNNKKHLNRFNLLFVAIFHFSMHSMLKIWSTGDENAQASETCSFVDYQHSSPYRTWPYRTWVHH